MRTIDNKHGLSTVFGTILLILLVSMPATMLFTAVYTFHNDVSTSLVTEEERIQERIILASLETFFDENGTELLYSVQLNNTGSIASRIRAFYIDTSFIYDPSSVDPSSGYVNPKNSLDLSVPGSIPYEREKKITVSTERGVKSSEYEWILKGEVPSYEYNANYTFGPLELNFTEFYYTECYQNGSYTTDPPQWTEAWVLPTHLTYFAWNITVTNVDIRDITINRYSCFTLFPIKSPGAPANTLVWYLESDLLNVTQYIPAGSTTEIVYVWSTPKSAGAKAQGGYSTDCQCKVFLTFFGIFHERNGKTKPYAQTIPFEAVRFDT